MSLREDYKGCLGVLYSCEGGKDFKGTEVHRMLRKVQRVFGTLLYRCKSS